MIVRCRVAGRLGHRRRDLRPALGPAPGAGGRRHALRAGRAGQPIGVHLLDGRPVQCRADAASAAVPASAWQRLSAGAGAKGPRLYDWARIPIRLLSEPGRYWLLVRRSLTDGELSHYLCFCPPETSLADL